MFTRLSASRAPLSLDLLDTGASGRDTECRISGELSERCRPMMTPPPLIPSPSRAEGAFRASSGACMRTVGLLFSGFTSSVFIFCASASGRGSAGAAGRIAPSIFLRSTTLSERERRRRRRSSSRVLLSVEHAVTTLFLSSHTERPSICSMTPPLDRRRSRLVGARVTPVRARGTPVALWHTAHTSLVCRTSSADSRSATRRAPTAPPRGTSTRAPAPTLNCRQLAAAAAAAAPAPGQ